MSARKNVLCPYKIINAVTMGADITSATVDGMWQDNIGIEVVWTSSDAVGVISVQASLSGTAFYDLTFNPTLTQPASNNGGYLINLNQLPYRYYRIKYTRTSGTGTFNAWVSSKEI